MSFVNIGAVKAKLYAGMSTDLYPYLPQKCLRIKIYNTLTVPILLYGIEIWTLGKRDKMQLRSFEMKVFRHTFGYALFDHERNEEILEEFEVEAVDEKLGRLLILAAKCNKNEPQLVSKRNDEL